MKNGYDKSYVYRTSVELAYDAAGALTVLNMGADTDDFRVEDLFEGGTEDILELEMTSWLRVTKAAVRKLDELKLPRTIENVLPIAYEKEFFDLYVD